MQNLHVVSHGLTWSMLCGATLFAAACASDPSAGDASSPAGSTAGTTRVPARLARAQTGQVGYHAMDPEIFWGDWDSAQDWEVPAVVLGGGAPVPVVDPNATALASLDVLWVETWFYNEMKFDEQWMARQPDLDAAVQNGMILVVHGTGAPWDGSAPPLPGAAGFFVSPPPLPFVVTDINIRDGSTQVTDGLTDSSLDLSAAEIGGSITPPTFVRANLLPPTAKLILSGAAPDEIVTFCYPHGQGAVIYSSIWLSEFTAEFEGPGYYPDALQNAMTKIYAPNVVKYALAGACKQ